MNDLNNDKNRRVLVIDDNRAIHDDFRKILALDRTAALAMDASEAALFGTPASAPPPTQFQVDSAYQGQEGVSRVAQAVEQGRPYAMAFVDVRMPPGMDGVETTEKIWAIDSEIQIVLCTAYSDASWDEMLARIGNNDRMVILKKPFDAVEAFQLAHALTEKWWLHRVARCKMEELESMVAERTRELRQTNDTLFRQHQELRESERRFADMLRNVELASVMLDRDARITYCNDFLLRLTGWQREELLGRGWFDIFVPPNVIEETRVAHAKLLAASPDAWHHENEIVTRSGARRLLRWNNSVLRSAAGEVIGTASLGEDITQSRRLETQLVQSQKMETVGKLAGGIAHEFNNIMAVIIGHSELLLDDLPALSPLAKSATEINLAAGRAATLTRQLLAYGRRQLLRPENLELNAVVSGMDGMIRHLLGANTDVRFIPAADLKLVRADAGQIGQVIINIVMNAADAMPKAGKLTLETSNATLDHEYVRRFSGLKAGDYVMLAITDTGPGLSEEVKARVFEPFFTTKDVGKGTGLGLSTCYGIIKQSGGHIAVYSETGRGATFKIYLPQVESLTKVSTPPPGSPGLPRGTETILVVEDDPALREMVSGLLGRLGYSVLAAGNGLEALALARQPATGPIDLLFTDVVMPHMSGKELADRVRAMFSDTMILFTSAYTEGAIAHQGVLDPGVELLQKPFTPRAMAQKIRAMLDGETQKAKRQVTA